MGTCTFPLFQASKVTFNMLIFQNLRDHPDTLLQTGSLSLRAGAHQEPLTLGRDRVPALSVLFRLLPHSNKHIAAPHYMVQSQAVADCSHDLLVSVPGLRLFPVRAHPG